MNALFAGSFLSTKREGNFNYSYIEPFNPASVTEYITDITIQYIESQAPYCKKNDLNKNWKIWKNLIKIGEIPALQKLIKQAAVNG